MRSPLVRVVGAAAALLLAGCSSSPAPESAEPPPAAVSPAPPPRASSGAEGFSRIVAGAGDSVSSLPGTPGAQYRYKFRMTAPSGGERFAYRDRDLSFYFRPSPTSIYFQVENLQNRQVTIDWNKSMFYGPNGQSGQIAHGTTRWEDRFSTQAPTVIAGLQRYGDYVFGMWSLVDPGGSGQQLHRVLFPEDEQAMTYTGRSYGMDLTLMVEDRPRVYSVRFVVDSVIPQ